MAQPLLAKPLLNQLIAIIQRDQAAAISTVNSSLAIIQEFHKGPRYRTTFPWLTLAYEESLFPVASEQSVQQTARFSLVLETGQFDTELAQDNALDYLRVLDTVIRNSGPPFGYADYETALPITHETVPLGTTTPHPTGTVKGLFIERESLEAVYREELEQPVLAVTMTLRVEFEEAGTAD